MNSCKGSAFSVKREWPQGDAMPNFFLDFKSSISGLSNEVSFVSELCCKGD